MKQNELRYTRRNNLGDYCSEEIGISVILEEGDKPSELFPKLKQFVMDRLEKQQAPAAKAPEAPKVAAPVVAAPAASKPLSAPVQQLNSKIAEAAKAAGVTTQW